MNIDVKILSKIRSTDFNIKKIILHDQVVLIPAVQEFLSMHKSINMAQHINKLLFFFNSIFSFQLLHSSALTGGFYIHSNSLLKFLLRSSLLPCSVTIFIIIDLNPLFGRLLISGSLHFFFPLFLLI